MMRLLLILFSLCLSLSGGLGRGVAAQSAEPASTSASPQSGSKAAEADAVANIDVDRPVADKWALVVGVSEFSDPSLNLKYASKDAEDFASFLVNEAHFADDHVHVLTNKEATKERILSELGDKWLPRVARPDDLVVLYISSHGSPSSMDIKGTNYVVAYNTDKESLYSTGLAMRDVVEAVKERVHAGRIVVILDACHSGAATAASKGLSRQSNFDADAIVQGTGQLVICSSEPAQVAWESKQYPNGVFTHHLIQALRQNGTKVSIGEAFKTLKESVLTEVQTDRGEIQAPVLKSRWSGHDLVLSVAPASAREGAGQSQTQGRMSPAGQSRQAQPARSPWQVGIAGTWDSNWGPTTFFHDPIEGNKPVHVSGYWVENSKKRGVFKSGTYDPSTGELKLSYYQSWNFMTGKAHFKLSPDGRRLEGRWLHTVLIFGPWNLWR